MNDFFYRKLDVYKKAMDFTDHIYRLVRSFPNYETYALADQMRRAAVSVPSNISEGMGHFSIKERIRFLEISYSSLSEVLCQTEIALRNRYISDQEFSNIEKEAVEVARMLSGLKSSLSKKIYEQ